MANDFSQPQIPSAYKTKHEFPSMALTLKNGKVVDCTHSGCSKILPTHIH